MTGTLAAPPVAVVGLGQLGGSLAAALVAAGRTVSGWDIEPAAREYGLGFLPLREERYDFVIPKSRLDRPAVRMFAELLRDPATRRGLEERGFRP